ncbi:hypothetical protein F5J12DRAFT_786355 [Pisolithus orientalis]|uniref:uncharacterized protein n=1 Tax=Pisolithus orientalis TaxID=936130 RepID=UPI002224F056|nr:uncharacterized protein F5J12DRAFT_786355 [Pisolithus orientalis]KAI5991277.1 hypothetical protein F5J12DRAFT_786355 [Pisolithus orientalis]
MENRPELCLGDPDMDLGGPEWSSARPGGWSGLEIGCQGSGDKDQDQGVFWEPEAREATTRRAGDQSRRLPGSSTGWDKAKLSPEVIRPAGQGFLETAEAEASVSGGWSHTLGVGQGNKEARSDQARLRGLEVCFKASSGQHGGQEGPERSRGDQRMVQECTDVLLSDTGVAQRPGGCQEDWGTSLGMHWLDWECIAGVQRVMKVPRRLGQVQGLLQGVTGSENMYLLKKRIDNRKLRKHVTGEQETRARGRGQSQRLRLRVARTGGNSKTEDQLRGQKAGKAGNKSEGQRGPEGPAGDQYNDRAVRPEMSKGDWYGVGQGQSNWLKAGLKRLEGFGVIRGDLRCYPAGGLITGGQNSVGWWANTETGVTRGSKMQSEARSGKAECQGWEWPRGGWFGGALGYKVQARTIKRSTGWGSRSPTTGVCQDWFWEAFTRPGKALKPEIQDQQGRAGWYRGSKECWSQKLGYEGWNQSPRGNKKASEGQQAKDNQ